MDILLTGSVAYDYLMKFPGYFCDHILPEKLDCISLSFLVESMVVHRGGVSPNNAYTLALLGVDHLCCGSFGRFDVLLHVAEVLKRSDLSADAAAQAADILGRTCRFRVTPGDIPGTGNPGCFDGLAGIGYVLLRLAAPDLLPSILTFE